MVCCTLALIALQDNKMLLCTFATTPKLTTAFTITVQHTDHLASIPYNSVNMTHLKAYMLHILTFLGLTTSLGGVTP